MQQTLHKSSGTVKCLQKLGIYLSWDVFYGWSNMHQASTKGTFAILFLNRKCWKRPELWNNQQFLCTLCDRHRFISFWSSPPCIQPQIFIPFTYIPSTIKRHYYPRFAFHSLLFNIRAVGMSKIWVGTRPCDWHDMLSLIVIGLIYPQKNDGDQSTCPDRFRRP